MGCKHEWKIALGYREAGTTIIHEYVAKCTKCPEVGQLKPELVQSIFKTRAEGKRNDQS